MCGMAQVLLGRVGTNVVSDSRALSGWCRIVHVQCIDHVWPFPLDLLWLEIVHGVHLLGNWVHNFYGRHQEGRGIVDFEVVVVGKVQ